MYNLLLLLLFYLDVRMWGASAVLKVYYIGMYLLTSYIHIYIYMHIHNIIHTYTLRESAFAAFVHTRVTTHIAA